MSFAKGTNQGEEDVINAALGGEQMYMNPDSGDIFCASIDALEVITENGIIELIEVFLIGSEWVEEKNIDAAIDHAIDEKFGDNEFVYATHESDPQGVNFSHDDDTNEFTPLSKHDVRGFIDNAIAGWGIPVTQCVYAVLSALTTEKPENETSMEEFELLTSKLYDSYIKLRNSTVKENYIKGSIRYEKFYTFADALVDYRTSIE